MKSLFWHDYETFGAEPQKDRPCQFAGVRTDLDLNILEDPITLYAKPSEDYLPAVQACLVTGITPQEATSKGIPEAEFARVIHEIFSQPETCVVGYNSIRFDDEVSRNLFFRNLYDPYEREWKNGNSRWDLIDVVRLTHALRPEGIEWPIGDDGKVSFRLERLSGANGISHESAHDAMSDVYATIGLAKLVKEKQPALYQWAFDMRLKASVNAFMEKHVDQPFLHVSSKIPVAKGCCAMMYPLMRHPVNQNAWVAFDLRQDPDILRDLSAEQIKERLYTKSSVDPSQDLNAERPALKLIHTNKCPMLAPASMISVIPQERLSAWDLDLNRMREHVRKLRAHRDSFAHIAEVFADDGDFPETHDPDLSIYSGGFLSNNDRSQLNQIRAMDIASLEGFSCDFDDRRLEEMLFRYKARNYPFVLESEERERWFQHCQNRLLDPKSEFRTFEIFARELQQAASQCAEGSTHMALLQDLQLYAESIYPY